MLQKLAPAALAMTLLAGARPARADAVSDFRNGTSLMLRTLTIAGATTTASSGNVVIGKDAGTLDIALAAADLGMALPVTWHLHGSLVGNGLVQFAIDETYSPGIAAGGGHTLTGVSGRLYAKVARVPGSETPQIGDVRLQIVNGQSYVNTFGDCGMQTIWIQNTDLIGGIPQPGLGSLVDTGEGLVCSDTVATSHPFMLWLTDAAQTGGAAIDLHESMPGGVKVPKTVIVPEGFRSTSVSARIEANFVGTAHLIAAAGGVTRTLDLVVHRRQDCVPPASAPAVQPWVPPGVAGCTNCTSYIDINRDRERLTTLNGRLVVVRGTQTIDVAQSFPNATDVSAEAINNDGTITGRLTIGSFAQAYRASMDHGAPLPLLLGAMTPKAINNYNLVVGYRVVNGANQAVYSNGHGVTPLGLTSPFGVTASRALEVADNARIAGTYTDSSGVVRGFKWMNGTTTTLPTLGAKPVLPVAINNAGQIAGNGATSTGQPLAALVAPNGTVTSLGVPSGYATFEAKSMNRFGVIVGVATATGLQRAYVWRPGSGFAPLTGYVANLVATDALRITDANQVVVRGTYNGAADLYLLTL